MSCPPGKACACDECIAESLGASQWQGFSLPGLTSTLRFHALSGWPGFLLPPTPAEHSRDRGVSRSCGTACGDSCDSCMVRGIGASPFAPVSLFPSVLEHFASFIGAGPSGQALLECESPGWMAAAPRESSNGAGRCAARPSAEGFSPTGQFGRVVRSVDEDEIELPDPRNIGPMGLTSFPVLYSWTIVPCPIGFVNEGVWCSRPSDEGRADPDLERTDTNIINRAFRQIGNNIDIIVDYFNSEVEVSPTFSDCVVALLLGGGVGAYGVFGINNAKLIVTEATMSDNAITWLPCVLPWIELNWCRIEAFSRGYALTDYNGIGAKACLVAELAGTLIHETCHVCCDLTNEVLPELISHYYRFHFARRHNYTDANHCCAAGNDLASYSALSYTDAADARNSTVRMGQQEVNGQCSTSGCS